MNEERTMNATNELAKALKLNIDEWACLEHRLTAEDAVADALCDVHPDDGVAEYSREDVEDVCCQLASGCLTHANEINPKLVAEVLKDAVLGSVWVGCAISEYGRHSQGEKAAYRTLLKTAHKVGKYIGDETLDDNCPDC